MKSTGFDDSDRFGDAGFEMAVLGEASKIILNYSLSMIWLAKILFKNVGCQGRDQQNKLLESRLEV